jgi:undecaprenyl pyrophosphate synthase
MADEEEQDTIVAAIHQGPVPEHIGIIMDGNRRYAKCVRIDVTEGHAVGFESLKSVSLGSFSPS